MCIIFYKGIFLKANRLAFADLKVFEWQDCHLTALWMPNIIWSRIGEMRNGVMIYLNSIIWFGDCCYCCCCFLLTSLFLFLSHWSEDIFMSSAKATTPSQFLHSAQSRYERMMMSWLSTSNHDYWSWLLMIQVQLEVDCLLQIGLGPICKR